MKKALFITILCLTLSSLGFSSGVFLRLSGGGTYLLGGDYNTVAQGRNDYYRSLSGYTISGEISKMVVAPYFTAELEYDPVDYAGISLGVGYIHAASGTGELTATGASDKITDTWTTQLTSMFLAPTLHANIPLTEQIKVHLSGGIGIYWPSFAFDRAFVQNSTLTNVFITFDSDKKSVVGFQASAGLEVGFTETVSGFIDAIGRWATFSGVPGSYEATGVQGGSLVTAAGTGFLWYHETESGGIYFPDWTLSANMPTGSNLRNVREAALSLGGVGIQLGLKIGF